eukprot:4480608-Amphidinium_carterae.1
MGTNMNDTNVAFGFHTSVVGTLPMAQDAFISQSMVTEPLLPDATSGLHLSQGTLVILSGRP